jgi:integrase
VHKHIVPALGDKRLDVLTRSPSLIQAWVAGLPVGASYAQQILSDLSGILDQAVTDSLIPRNPCKAAAVRAPRAATQKLVPWTREQVAAVRDFLSGPLGAPTATPRYAGIVDCGAGLGLRQGEIFALSLDEVDWLRRRVVIRQQVKLHLGVTPVFAPPKGGKDRIVPLPAQVPEALAQHIAAFPAAPVTLP